MPEAHQVGRLGRAVMLWLVTAVALTNAALAQVDDLVDRPVSSIRVVGLQRVSEQLVRNQLRVAIGDPYDTLVSSEDVRRMNRLGEFASVEVTVVLQNDGTVQVVYVVEEQAIITAVQVVGNRLISDQELLSVVRLAPGLPRDDFLVEKAKRDMEDLYREKGHYLAAVTLDETELDQRGILLFRIIEGPRVKVKAVTFENNEAFSDKQLSGQVKTRKAVPFVKKGVLDQDIIAADLGALDRFYKDRGYLDIRVDRRIDLSPDSREAKIVYIVDEGRQFTLRRVQAESVYADAELEVFAPEQIAAILEIKPGDVYSEDLVRKSVRLVRESYGLLGFLNVRVVPYERRLSERPEVDLLLRVDEGEYARVGLVRVGGNFLTKDKIIRRHVRLYPGRPFDAGEINRSNVRLRQTRLFNDVRITVQEPDPDSPLYRDVLVEVKERNTGSINFGVAVGSDSGLFGDFSVNQDNFDIADVPESFNELVKGAAFRGAGQRFNMTLRPGNELFQYSMSLVEPNLFETPNSLSLIGSFRQRVFEDYTEDRITGRIGLGRRLGDIWDIGLRLRAERIKLFDIDADAPTEVFEDAGPDNINSVGVTLTRSTIGQISRPGRGSRTEVSFEHAGLGGDVDFNTVTANYTVYITLDEDFLGRKETLKLTTKAGYIFGERAPVYERFYLGGRSFRGFEFRTISPKGIKANNGRPSEEPIGGDFMFFLGAQYEFPIFGDAFSWVFFVDSGTVQAGFGLDEYRVSIGTGIRMSIPQLGPVPLAFDFAIPLLKQKNDQTQTFSFSAELPF